jgi:hypothetical protein
MGRTHKYASLASLTLFVAMSALWMRSYFRYSGPNIPLTSSTEVSVLSGHGVIRIAARKYLAGINEGISWFSMDPQSMPPHIVMFKKSFKYKPGRVTARDGSAIAMTVVCFPHWLLVILFAVLPLRWVWGQSLLPSRRRRLGLCIKCGYNLTANTSGVCPECGEVLAMRDGPAAGATPTR